ncbi:MAG: two-component regulator propeller domain-containing protein [Bacteroidales bacterium]|nr:two-component regulator propeller domain-containing protein [Bacteroidales bacterium]
MKTSNLLVQIFLFSIITLLTPFMLKAQFSNVPIGSWRDHLSYYQTQKLAIVEDRVLVSAGSAMFFYDKDDNSIERFSKVNGLTDAGIVQLAYDKISKCIIVVYDNSNIDIIQEEKVFNIPDIKIRSIEGSKSINNIAFHNKKAYLSCGFGIVVLDLERKEIFETYYIGENSSKININSVVIDNDSIYAATVNGLFYAPYNSPSLATSETWKKYESLINPSNTEINYLFKYKDKLMVGVRINDLFVNLLERNNDTWDTVFSNLLAYWIKPTDDYLVIKTWGSSSQSIDIYDSTYTQKRLIDVQWGPIFNEYDNKIITPEFGDAVIVGNNLWLSHQKAGGLIYLNNFESNSTAKSIFPNGPLSNAVFSITATNEKIYVAPGGRDIQHAPRGFPGNIYHFDGYYWDCLSNFLDYENSLKDIIQVSVDPRNPNHLMAASWWNGVIEILDNKIIKIWDSSNTENILSNPSYGYRIAGAEYDPSSNLIIANSLASTAFCYYNYRNEWGNFNTFNSIGQTEVLGLLLDRFNEGNFYKFLWTNKNEILALDNNNNQIIIDPNNGAKDQSNKINCMVQDQEGEIWIGTDKGIKVIYSLDELFEIGGNNKSAVTCNNIIYQEEGIAQYLLNFENINCIMCDGGNRKWVGTERNGIFVFSPSGDKQIYHFTSENSPLYSNRVITMAQDPKTGEVYIGTDLGVISYKAESIKAVDQAGSLTAYPNPVKPDYNGIIAIKGFVANSDVRITDVAGNMVAHTKSIGGQAIWDGKNFKGEKVSSGVYLIFGSALEGKETASGKLLIVR